MKDNRRLMLCSQLLTRAPEILERGSPDVAGQGNVSPPEGLQLFTPDLVPGYRIVMFVAKQDVQRACRPEGWEGVLADVPTGIRVAVRTPRITVSCQDDGEDEFDERSHCHRMGSAQVQYIDKRPAAATPAQPLQPGWMKRWFPTIKHPSTR